MAKEKRVVFSTKFIKEITQKMDDGFQIPMAESPYFKNILGVRRENLTFRMSEDELDEYVKSKLDVNYFADNYCKVKIEDGSYDVIKLRDYQGDILNMFDENKFSILMSSRQVGKCSDLITSVLAYHTSSDTLIKTPLYKLYYGHKNDKSIFDKIKYWIYRTIDELSR